ncbi:TPA: TraV family lipoprotein [Vibrio parahaemolyticus]|uniref:TraV family lipoprotein n=1 Tax=Vibrio TaxID=662 RepID=UPI001493308F|nr:MULTISPECIES: TraV family lipoprotein [Vibrio]MDE1315498.1 TraV family lipoprotein [Vibrio aestuarianus]NOI88279.1 TraV family lipoprotein [Vibrio sp. 99K-1]
MKKILLLTGIISLAGCSVLPYESEFQCPNAAGTGKCVSVEQAYEEAETGIDATKKTEATAPAATDDKTYNTLYEYENEQYKALAGLLREPETPVVMPAKVVRTLIMSYPDNPMEQTRIYMPRFVYSIEKKPQFVFGQYKLQDDVGVDIFKALGGQPNGTN